MKDEPAERPGSSAIVPATSPPAPGAAQPDSDAHARWIRMQASSSRSVASA